MIRTRAALIELVVLFVAAGVAMWAAAAGSRVLAVLACSIVGACAVLLAMHDRGGAR